MDQLTNLIESLGTDTKQISIGGLLYNQLERTPNNTYLFTNSQSSDKFETQLCFLRTLYQDGRLFDPDKLQIKNEQRNISKVQTITKAPRIPITLDKSVDKWHNTTT